MSLDQNIAIPFTTLHRSLAAGDGLIYFDHGDRLTGSAEILAVARACGREQDVQMLICTTRQSPPSVSSTEGSFRTFNPFAQPDIRIDALRQLLVNQVEADEPSWANDGGIFKARALQVTDALLPILMWLRDNRGLQLGAETICHALSFSTLAHMAFFQVYQPPTAAPVLFLPGGALGETLCGPLRSYFLDTASYNPSFGPDSQPSSEPARQHSFVTFYFRSLSRIVSEFAGTFGSGSPDIDMDDVLFKARVLVVRLPSLEVSRHSYEPLVRLVLSSLNAAMSTRIGVQPDVAPAALPRPVTIVLSPGDAQALPGFDRMMAFGRALGVRFCFGFLGATASRPTGLQGLLSVLSSLRPPRLLRPRGTSLRPPIAAAARPQAPSRPSSENAA